MIGSAVWHRRFGGYIDQEPIRYQNILNILGTVPKPGLSSRCYISREWQREIKKSENKRPPPDWFGDGKKKVSIIMGNRSLGAIRFLPSSFGLIR